MKRVERMSTQLNDRSRQLEQLIRADGRYPLDAFEFLRLGLAHATQRVYAARGAAGDAPRHVTGQQLCVGLVELARKLWGPLAPLVLARWSIRTTRDFGEMVFLLVEAGFLGRQDSDRIEDFNDVLDLSTAFDDYAVNLSAVSRG